jgi:hypothetical protein
MVGSLEVHNLELDVLGAVVLPGFPEGNWQDHCGLAAFPGTIPLKGDVLFVSVGNVELHLLQGLGEKDIEPASTVDECLVDSGARDYWFEGLIRRTREGGSEWELIKILFKNSTYEPDFTRAPPQASLAKFTQPLKCY